VWPTNATLLNLENPSTSISSTVTVNCRLAWPKLLRSAPLQVVRQAGPLVLHQEHWMLKKASLTNEQMAGRLQGQQDTRFESGPPLCSEFRTSCSRIA